MKKLYFIRHGESVLNVKGLYAGITDTPLTKNGRHQAKNAGIYAQQLSIDLIVSSPLSRALETAKIIATEIGYPLSDILINDLLIERNGGAQEGQPYAGPKTDFSIVDGAENDSMLKTRAQEIIKWLDSFPNDNILVASHGGTGRAMKYLLVEGAVFTEQIPNAGIIQFL